MSFWVDIVQTARREADITLGIKKVQKQQAMINKETILLTYLDILGYPLDKLISKSGRFITVLSLIYTTVLCLCFVINSYCLLRKVIAEPANIYSYKNLGLMFILNNPIYWLSIFVLPDKLFVDIYTDTAYDTIISFLEKQLAKVNEQIKKGSEVPQEEIKTPENNNNNKTQTDKEEVQLQIEEDSNKNSLLGDQK